MKKFLRVWLAACPKGSIRAKILVYKSYFATLRIQVRHNLASGAGGFVRAGRSRMFLPN